MDKLTISKEQIQQQKSETSSRKKPTQRQEDLAKALMQKFRVIFPQKWDAQYKTTELAELALKEWALGIQYLSNYELAAGVEAVRLNCHWPPSIAEFVGLCAPTQPNEHWEHKQQKYGYIPRSRRIEKKPDMEKVNAERQKLRDMGILK